MAQSQGGSHEQHVKAGEQSHKNDKSNDKAQRTTETKGSTRGGTPEQHAEAGRQSHKNDDK